MNGQALITGGSGGIGSAIAARLAAAGYRCAVGYHQGAQAAAEVVAGLAGTGHDAVEIDVGDSASLARLAHQLTPLDVLVNCAGITRPVPTTTWTISTTS